MKNYNIDTIFRFGKHVNKKLLEVCQMDSSYISWCIVNLDDFFISKDNLEIIANRVLGFNLSTEANLKHSQKNTLFMKNTNSSNPNQTSQADAIIHYVKHLDIDMLETLLDSKLTYQDFPKSTFIQKLNIYEKAHERTTEKQCIYIDCVRLTLRLHFNGSEIINNKWWSYYHKNS